MPMRRVVVTGLGVVSALGLTRAAHFEGLREGRLGIGPLRRVPTANLSITIGAEVPEFDPAAAFERGELAFLDRVTQLALLAGREAVAQSGLAIGEALAPRAAVVMGCSLGGMGTVDENYRLTYGEGKTRVHPFLVPRLMTNAPASQLSMAHGAKGPNWTVSTACSSSNHAIGQAFHLVRSGGADVALCGGAEAALTWGTLKAWEGLRVMSKTACRPFSRSRDGMVQGEGAAVLVIETLEHAEARGAPILAEIAGFAMTSDAGDIVTPSMPDAARAIRGALEDARMAPEEVGYINAHGTATAINDRTEAAAIRAVLGEHAARVPVSSTKSMHGHCIGAAGAIEAAAVILALTEGVIAPTIGHEEEDPEIGLDVVPNTAREARVGTALSNSFAFGGLNAVLAFRRFGG